MRRSARVAVASLATAVLLGLAPHVARPDPPAAAAGEREFLSALERARRLLASGDVVEGRRLAGATLARHEGQDYVRAKRADIEDLVTRLAFRAECPPPDPATLVQGTLTKYVSKTGEIEVRYRDGEKTDLEKDEDGDLWFPARFCGPFSIVLRGSAYPTTSEATPRILVGMESDRKTGRVQTWAVNAGIPQYDEGSKFVWLPARLLHHDGDRTKTLFEKETSLAKPGKPWRLEVRVGKTRIAATIDGKPLGSGPKPDGVFGRAMLDVDSWSEIVVSGQVEPSWLQTKIDGLVEGKRAAFLERFDVRKELPAWLYEAPKARPPAEGTGDEDGEEEEDEPEFAGLGDLPEALGPLLPEYRERLESEDWRGALEVVERLRAGGAPAALAGWFAVPAHLALGESKEALAALDAALVALPDSAPAHALRAGLLLRMGRDEEAAKAWKTLAGLEGADVDLLSTAAISLLYAGHPNESREVFEAASRRGVDSPLLSAVGRVLVQASRGPAWPKTYEYKSTNYHVLSDIDAETCKRAAEILEESLTVYRIHVRPLRAAPRKTYRVFLFGGQAGFQRYLADVTLLQGRAPEHAAGIYSPLLKQLLIWNLDSRAEMMRTVRHEGFHQYLDRLLPDPPVWFNEGMAVYYEGMEKVAGEMRSGLPRAEEVEELGEGPMVPLAQFLFVSPKDFYAGSHRSYAQAWLLVHMLRHGTPKHRDLYRDLLTRLETSTAEEAVRAVFDEATIATLDRDLDAYRKSLSKR
jgi:tetratricopeptide (TPR) repeat protein